jgi:hypothetical protein
MSTSIETRSDRPRAGVGSPSGDRRRQAPAESPAPATIRTLRQQPDLDRLRSLAEEVRHAVVQATLAPDLDAKLRWWSRYRSARAQAMALLRRGRRRLGAVGD